MKERYESYVAELMRVPSLGRVDALVFGSICSAVR